MAPIVHDFERDRHADKHDTSAENARNEAERKIRRALPPPWRQNRKQRSEIKQHRAISDGEGPRRMNEGAPAQKPVAVMTWLLLKAGQAEQ